MLIYAPRILANLRDQDEVVISVEELVASEQELRSSKPQVQDVRRSNKKPVRKFHVPIGKFDPNTYSKSDWTNLGLSDKQAEVVLKFTSYGVYSNEALKKIYVIPDELFELIKDSTVYPSSGKSLNEVELLPETTIQPVNLNTATYENLIAIKGIGDFYAKRILEYRSELGGFVRKEQLLDLWKFSPEKLSEIEPQIIITGEINKININLASYDELAAHPYISYKVANSIVKMRQQRGSYENLRELKESKLIDEELFEKLKPYIKL